MYAFNRVQKISNQYSCGYRNDQREVFFFQIMKLYKFEIMNEATWNS